MSKETPEATGNPTQHPNLTSFNTDLLLDARVAALETRLGLRSASEAHDGHAPGIDANAQSVDTRQTTADKHTTPQFRSLWKESLDLLWELDPGPGLTHQQQPLLYKCQEVLAVSDTLQRDMGEVAKIMHLLSQGQNTRFF